MKGESNTRIHIHYRVFGVHGCPMHLSWHALKRSGRLTPIRRFYCLKLPLELGSFLETFGCICDRSTPTTGTMPQPTSTARAVLNALPRVVPRQCAQQCTRLMSTARSAPTKRPTAPSPARIQSQPYQPLVQRRFKYSTVEEAKSRYKSGVRIAENWVMLGSFGRRLTSLLRSPSRGRQGFSSSSPAPAWCGILRTKRTGCSARG